MLADYLTFVPNLKRGDERVGEEIKLLECDGTSKGKREAVILSR